MGEELKVDFESVFKNNKNEIFATIPYCELNCEFYNTCFANSTTCIKKYFEEYLDSLIGQERDVIQDSFGYNGAAESLEMISERYGISVERVRQVQAKALRKLRHPSRSRRMQFFVPDVFLSGKDNFYSRLLCAIFDFQEQELLEYQLGIDFSVIWKEQSSHKTPLLIKTELNSQICDITILNDYLRYLSDYSTTTLYQLLRMDAAKLNLSVFDNDDVAFLKFIRTIYDMGYRFKFFRPEQLAKEELLSKVRKHIIQPEVYDVPILDLSLETTLKLLEHNVVSIDDLLSKINTLKSIGCLSPSNLMEIDAFLSSKGFVVNIDKREMLYLSKTFVYYLAGHVVDRMVENECSVKEYLTKLETKQVTSLEAIQQICLKNPDIVTQTSFENSDLIEHLDLSVRTYHCLCRAGIRTVNDLLQLKPDELFAIRHLGRNSIEELEEKMSSMGFSILSK